MKNIFTLIMALEYVEDSMDALEPVTPQKIAEHCSCSLSLLQKIFRYAFRCPVATYINKRKLSLASHALIHSDKTITEIALDYHYGSPEVFTRAFARFWGIAPSHYRKNYRFTELFPKFVIEPNQGGFIMPSERKQVDISDFYKELKKLENSYVLCTDICGLTPINDTYGHAAGDIAIAESAKRIDKELTNDMFMFRIGRDEFAVVTGLYDSEEAEALAKRILAHNEERIQSGEHTFPLSMRIGACTIPLSGGNLKEIMDAAML